MKKLQRAFSAAYVAAREKYDQADYAAAAQFYEQEWDILQDYCTCLSLYFILNKRIKTILIQAVAF
ncbi:MAG: hypothetical protein LBE22_04585 [Azoarcus sp.]|jgi:hypothetical protein|nr:hypothetical protein [Azoarcus sp.]